MVSPKLNLIYVIAFQIICIHSTSKMASTLKLAGRHGSPAKWNPSHYVPLNYPMLMYLPVMFWFCYWTACQQWLISNGQRLLMGFISIKQIKCVAAQFLMEARVWYVILGKSYRSGIVYISTACVDMSQLFIDHGNQMARSLELWALWACSASVEKKRFGGRTVPDIAIYGKYFQLGTRWVALVWTLQINIWLLSTS